MILYPRSLPIRTARSSTSHNAAYIALIILTVVLGLVVRRVPMGLPLVVVKFGGSMLWAAMIYWIFAAIRTASAADVALNASLFSIAVEFFKLYHASALDDFRRTLAGTLLLGRYFSWWDIVAYLVAITLASLADQRLIRRA